MKPYAYLLLLLFTSNIYAQEVESNSKKGKEIQKTEKVNSPLAITDEIKFKNETDNAIITITDEGNNAGSILLPSVGSLLNGAKLYSNGINLFWGNSQLNGSNGATEINELSDAQYDGSSLYIGNGAGGINDDGGNLNTAVGKNALNFNTTGNSNTATGSLALNKNTIGHENTANGRQALFFNTTGHDNTANGSSALSANTTGNSNTATGRQALFFNTTANENTANGVASLFANKIGIRNTANGFGALYKNYNGHYNTATGYKALYSNTDGSSNTANGYRALYSNTTGNNNISIGYDAQVPNSASSNQVRIGNASISYAGIQKAWSITSDRVWKEQIRTLPYGLDMLMQLKPVDYIRKNSDIKTREIGFIAQDIEEVITKFDYADQGFLTKDDEGHLNLRYNDFIPLLTKAMQEQQEIIKKQGELVVELVKRIKELEK